VEEESKESVVHGRRAASSDDTKQEHDIAKKTQIDIKQEKEWQSHSADARLFYLDLQACSLGSGVKRSLWDHDLLSRRQDPIKSRLPVPMQLARLGQCSDRYGNTGVVFVLLPSCLPWDRDQNSRVIYWFCFLQIVADGLMFQAI
jgi:hypothetical protein